MLEEAANTEAGSKAGQCTRCRNRTGCGGKEPRAAGQGLLAAHGLTLSTNHTPGAHLHPSPHWISTTCHLHRLARRKKSAQCEVECQSLLVRMAAVPPLCCRRGAMAGTQPRRGRPLPSAPPLHLQPSSPCLFPSSVSLRQFPSWYPFSFLPGQISHKQSSTERTPVPACWRGQGSAQRRNREALSTVCDAAQTTSQKNAPQDSVLLLVKCCKMSPAPALGNL